MRRARWFIIYRRRKKEKKNNFHQLFPPGGQYNIKKIRTNVQNQPDKKALDETYSKQWQMMLLDRCRRKLNQVNFPLQNTDWKTDFIFKNSQSRLYLQILQIKRYNFSCDTFFKGEIPRTTVWPHLFESGFYFHFQLYADGKEASPAQSNRSLATNFKETTSILLHFLLILWQP